MTDLEAIAQIKQELDVPLEQVEDTYTLHRTTSYILDAEQRVTELSLHGCVVGNLERIIAPLIALTGLTQLNLMDNEISDLSPLGQLTNLSELHLTYNQISDLSPLSVLTSLTVLELGSNQISDLSPLGKLKNLTDLSLFYNDLGDLLPLGELTSLVKLRLGVTKISDLSPLSTLTNLTELTLGGNQISDLSPLSALTNLDDLYLSNNQVSDLTPLAQLTNLTKLDVGMNGLSDVSALSALTKLTSLVLSRNQISDIDPLQALSSLNYFNLSYNPIETLPPWIAGLDLEIWWDESDGYSHDFTGIIFYRNPLKSPPPEIIKQGREAVRNYFQQRAQQQDDYLFEAKMLIVGEPGAGKTTLARKIQNPDCELPTEDETTRGIEVLNYSFPLHREDFATFEHPAMLENRYFRVNLWDFGGQRLYRATHRFFLSQRSLYALVADSRNEDTDFDYWLHLVEMFGGDSPLLIVLNEKFGRERDIDIPALRQRFPNITDILRVDFGEGDPTRLEALRRAIRYHASQLPHIGSPLPAKWTVIRQALEQDPRNTLSLQDYLGICRDNSIDKVADALVLSQFFHDIGVFLHFQDDPLLNKTIFLKPDWATSAVYTILEHELLDRQKGRFDRLDAQTIWSQGDYPLFCDELLRLMQRFYITYQIATSGQYIVPERLPSAQPEYDWDPQDNLFLQYGYEVFMPKGILSQLTVEMNPYIVNHNLVWRRGVVLQREHARAEIVESYDARSIRIRISGPGRGGNRRDFMTIITEQLDRINSQYERMRVDKRIPCNCSECRASDEPYFYKDKALRRRIEKGQRQIQCEHSYELVSVQSLIDDVLNPEMVDRGPRNLEGAPFEHQPKSVPPEYVNYDLHIGPNGHTVASSKQAGQANTDISTTVPKAIGLALKLVIKNELDADILKDIGRTFYDWLFPGPIHTHLEKTVAVAKAQGAKVRLRLRIESDEIARQPLEFLYRDTGGLYLAEDPNTVLSRYLQVEQPTSRVRRREGPLHMLAIISNPRDQVHRLPPDEWEEILMEALAGPVANGKLTLKTVKKATHKEIRNALLEQDPDIVQFVGHGEYRDDKGYLALREEEINKTWWVDHDQFAGLFLGHDDNLGLISLASCESAGAVGAGASASQPFAGIAPKLVQRGAPAVLAMQYKVKIKTAKLFLETFYAAVAARKPVDWATQSARRAIAVEFGYDNREFATPVLYMRAEDGKLF